MPELLANAEIVASNGRGCAYAATSWHGAHLNHPLDHGTSLHQSDELHDV